MGYSLKPKVKQSQKIKVRPSFKRKKGGSFALFFFLFASISLLIFGFVSPNAIETMRDKTIHFSQPLVERVSTRIKDLTTWRPFVAQKLGLEDELKKLRTENEQLKIWRGRAMRMENKLIALQKLLNVTEDPAIKITTGRVINDVASPFKQTVLLNVGTNQNVKSGFAVTSHEGLVGRIVSVSERGSRVLLLSDYNSRIPVNIGRGDVKAIMNGDNSARPVLASLAANQSVKEGDLVYSSGLGGLLPRGLDIGTVIKDGQTWRVKLKSSLNQLDYVGVMFFTAPRLEAAGGNAKGLTRRIFIPIDKQKAAGLDE